MTMFTATRRRFIQMASAVAISAAGLLRTGFAKAGKPARGIPELADFKGEVITRDDPLYMAWFWGMSWYKNKPARFPLLIVIPVDEHDVQLAVAYANTANLRITMRSSGHNITASALREGALTIDMAKFNQISIAPQQKTVWAGPGVFSEQLNEALSKYNLAFPSAHTGFVSLGGYLLGGGMGWNMPAWGMASNAVLELEAILADGSKIVASPSQNPDLYWAARGAGPAFFAVILRYKLRVYHSPKVIQNIYYVPVEKIEEGVQEMLRLVPESRNRTEILGALGRFSPPGTPDGEKSWHWVLMLYSYAATTTEALAAAAIFTENPFLKTAAFQFSHNKPLEYIQLYAQLGNTDAYSIFRTTELAFFTENPGRCLRTTLDMLNTRTSNPLSFGFSVLACNPTVAEPACYTYGAPHYISWYLISTAPEEVKANEQLAVELHDRLKPEIKTYYMNEVDFTLFPDAIPRSFSPEKWEKLQQVRSQFDPDKRFVTYVGIDKG